MQIDSETLTHIRVACDAIEAVMVADRFRDRFSATRLLRSIDDLECATATLPSHLLPFMAEEQQNSTDIYAFDIEKGKIRRVVVWNDHAVVEDWPTFQVFISWLRGNTPTA